MKNVAYRLALTAGVVFLAMPHEAFAAKKVYRPSVEQGELEIESKTQYDIDGDDEQDGAWQEQLSVGYGVNQYWYTELMGEVEKEAEDNADAEFTAVEWENRFQITQPGQYFVDVGALAAVELNTQGGADKGEVKLLLGKDMGKFSHVANIGAEREFGDDAEDKTEFDLSLSSRYRYTPEFEPGIEVYSEFGALDDGSSFDEESHQVGPVAYGKLGNIKYDAGVLFGVSDAAPDATLKLNLEYEIKF